MGGGAVLTRTIFDVSGWSEGDRGITFPLGLLIAVRTADGCCTENRREFRARFARQNRRSRRNLPFWVDNLR
jgi:hypothetical protein